MEVPVHLVTGAFSFENVIIMAIYQIKAIKFYFDSDFEKVAFHFLFCFNNFLIRVHFQFATDMHASVFLKNLCIFVILNLLCFSVEEG